MTRLQQRGSVLVEFAISFALMLPVLGFVSYTLLTTLRYWQATYTITQSLRQARINLINDANGEPPQEIFLASVFEGLQNDGFSIDKTQLKVCRPPFGTNCGCSLATLELLRTDRSSIDPDECRKPWFDVLLLIQFDKDWLGYDLFQLAYSHN